MGLGQSGLLKDVSIALAGLGYVGEDVGADARVELEVHSAYFCVLGQDFGKEEGCLTAEVCVLHVQIGKVRLETLTALH